MGGKWFKRKRRRHHQCQNFVSRSPPFSSEERFQKTKTSKQTNTKTWFKKLACWKILCGCFHFMVKENYSLEKHSVRSSVLGWTKREVRVGGGVGAGWCCSIFEKVMISATEQLQPGKTVSSLNFGVLDQEFWLPLMMKLLEHQTWMRKTDLAPTTFLFFYFFYDE